AAKLLGITDRQLGNWSNEPWFPADGKTADGWDVNIIASARDAVGRKGSDDSDAATKLRLATAAERLKLTKAKAQREELALEEDRGLLIPRPAIELFASTVLTELADWCDQLPDLVAASVPRKHRRAVRDRLRDELDQRRRELRERLEREVYDCILPRDDTPADEWVERWIRMPADSKLHGTYRLDLFPHFREPFQLLTDPDIDRITIQTAAQVGKTAWAQACLAYIAATNPHPMAFADADERSTKRVIRRTWRLFERCELIEPLCPPPRLRAGDHMSLKTCEIHGAWAGSAASAADYGAFLVVLNECDKMKQKKTDTEADFRELMGERTKGYVGAKILAISTPAMLGSSYVEAQRLAGDNRRRLVPCPHCGHYQELRTGNGRDPGGIKFSRNKTGEIDPAIARETAYYECESCLGEIHDEHRYDMLNAGLWVPEGCDVRDGEIVGTPARPGRHASFGPLSTLHSMLPGVTFGVYAEAWAKALTARERKGEALRNFVNSWEGRTWDPQPIRVKPSDIVIRLGVDEPLRLCPIWSRFLTIGGDVGRVGETLLFYWLCSAWGPGGRGQLIDYGIAWDTDAMLATLAAATYPHADDGPPLRPVHTGFDSGSLTNTIYDFCRPIPNCWPIKGSSQDPDKPFVSTDFPEMYRPGFQRTGTNAAVLKAKQKTGQYDLLIANTQRTQEWVEDRLTGLVKRADPNWYSIPLEALEGMAVAEVDLTRHLLGDVQTERGNWAKRYDDQDFRDALRYSMLLAWHYTSNGTAWDRLAPRSSIIPKPAADRAEESTGFVRQPKANWFRR
ncbi:Terminase, partial [Durusdinium trenchii]